MAALTLAPVALQLQLNVVRYAMVDMLKRPPRGFEDVVTGHFRLMRHRQVPPPDCVVCEVVVLRNSRSQTRCGSLSRKLSPNIDLLSAEAPCSCAWQVRQ